MTPLADIRRRIEIELQRELPIVSGVGDSSTAPLKIRPGACPIDAEQLYIEGLARVRGCNWRFQSREVAAAERGAIDRVSVSFERPQALIFKRSSERLYFDASTAAQPASTPLVVMGRTLPRAFSWLVQYEPENNEPGSPLQDWTVPYRGFKHVATLFMYDVSTEPISVDLSHPAVSRHFSECLADIARPTISGDDYSWFRIVGQYVRNYGDAAMPFRIVHFNGVRNGQVDDSFLCLAVQEQTLIKVRYTAPETAINRKLADEYLDTVASHLSSPVQ